MRNVCVGGFVAGSRALATKAASSSTCLAASIGSETFHSIGVSPGRRAFDTSNGWSVIRDR